MNCARLESLIQSINKLVDYKPSLGDLQGWKTIISVSLFTSSGRIAPFTAPRTFSEKVVAASSPLSGMPKPAPEPCRRSSGAFALPRALGASGLNARTGTRYNEFSLHLGQTGHHVKEKEPCGRLCVDAVGDALEMDLLDFKFVSQVHQSFHTASEPIQFPDHEGIGFVQLRQCLSSRTSDLRAAEFVRENWKRVE